MVKRQKGGAQWPLPSDKARKKSVKPRIVKFAQAPKRAAAFDRSKLHEEIGV